MDARQIGTLARAVIGQAQDGMAQAAVEGRAPARNVPGEKSPGELPGGREDVATAPRPEVGTGNGAAGSRKPTRTSRNLTIRPPRKGPAPKGRPVEGVDSVKPEGERPSRLDNRDHMDAAPNVMSGCLPADAPTEPHRAVGRHLDMQGAHRSPSSISPMNSAPASRLRISILAIRITITAMTQIEIAAVGMCAISSAITTTTQAPQSHAQISGA